MARTRATTVIGCLTILAAAGAATAQSSNNRADRSAAAERQHMDGPTHPDKTMDAMGKTPVTRMHQIVGATVKNPAGDKVGTIDDLIISPRGGAVVYAVLSHGGFLGIGDKLVAFPWQSTRWSDSDRTVTIDVTKKQLEQAPNFSGGDWPDLNDKAWFDQVARYFGADPDWANSHSSGWSVDSWYQRQFKPDRSETIRGTVSSIQPVYPAAGMSEGVEAIVRGDDNREHVVQLGPAFYVSTVPPMLKKGDQVVIHGWPWTSGVDRVTVASSVEVNGQTARYRDASGRPAWANEADSGQADQRFGRGNAPADEPAFVRATKVRGAEVDNDTGQNIGDVEDLVVARSGHIPFAVLSVGGFLGIGDRLVPVPWRALEFQKQGPVRAAGLDKETLKAAPSLDDDNWQQLSDRSYCERVRSHYAALLGEPGRGAAEDRDRYARGTSTSVDGSVKSIDEHGAARTGTSDSVVVTLKTDHGDRMVALAPQSYLRQQGLTIHKGDSLSATGSEVSSGGDHVVLAAKVTCGGKTVRLRDDAGSPLWLSSDNARRTRATDGER